MALQVMEGEAAVVCSRRKGFVDLGWVPWEEERGGKGVGRSVLVFFRVCVLFL